MLKNKKILFVNPSKWGRGITPIWIASHVSLLRKNKYECDLFDCTFYSDWSDYEIKVNTDNLQFQESKYLDVIKFKKNIYEDLNKKIYEFKPDIVFWSALSSHIHGEGEYVNIDQGYDLLKKIKKNFLMICGGIQATVNPNLILDKYNNIDIVISGESEKVLLEICKSENNQFDKIKGLTFRKNNKKIFNTGKQEIFNDLDFLCNYDYSVFDDQVFLRPYNGKIVRAVDYEISRGCIYTCAYCVETVIQKYYDLDEHNSNGTLLKPKNYLRNKSAKKIFEELKYIVNNFQIELFRCQDTNFLTIDRSTLIELSDLIDNSDLKIKLYIETRPEGINEKSIELLKKLKVDGVGMGIEMSDNTFRKGTLNRHVDQDRIVKAFQLLANHGINRTAYNIIGLPDQTEESIVSTIEFNIKLNPDVSSVAYYSVYSGTNLGDKNKINYEENLNNMDAQIRSKIINHSKIDKNLFKFYKNNFNYFIKNKMLNYNKMRTEWLQKFN